MWMSGMANSPCQAWTRPPLRNQSISTELQQSSWSPTSTLQAQVKFGTALHTQQFGCWTTGSSPKNSTGETRRTKKQRQLESEAWNALVLLPVLPQRCPRRRFQKHAQPNMARHRCLATAAACICEALVSLKNTKSAGLLSLTSHHLPRAVYYLKVSLEASLPCVRHQYLPRLLRFRWVPQS